MPNSDSRQPELVFFERMMMAGVEARTSNQLEMHFQTAKIPDLWKEFRDGSLTLDMRDKKVGQRIVAAYTNYESDVNGMYTLIVGYEITTLDRLTAGLKVVTIPAGSYLLFRAQGEMPMALIETWRYIWSFFSDSREYERAYSVDFELYESDEPSRVGIYVGVKHAPANNGA